MSVFVLHILLPATHNINQELGYSNAPHLAEVGMSVETRPLQITARQLEPPTIFYGQESEVRYASQTLPWQRR